MVGERFDASPLIERPTGPAWRAFRNAAIAGEHGEDLRARHWWKPYEYGFFFAAFALALPTIPTALLVLEGPTLLSVSMSAVWIVALLIPTVITLRVRRRDLWSPKARERFQLTVFAQVNGLTYEPAPRTERLAAHMFDSASPKRQHLDCIAAPAPHGFIVANYREARDWDGAEPYWFEAGYAVFPLRNSFPHYFATKQVKSSHAVKYGPRGLRSITPAVGPGGFRIRCAKPDHPPLVHLLESSGILDHASSLGGTTQVEIIGNQLFVLHPGGFWPLTSPAFWSEIARISDALERTEAELSDLGGTRSNRR